MEAEKCSQILIKHTMLSGRNFIEINFFVQYYNDSKTAKKIKSQLKGTEMSKIYIGAIRIQTRISLIFFK